MRSFNFQPVGAPSHYQRDVRGWDPAEQVDWMKGFRWIPNAFTTSHTTRHFFFKGISKTQSQRYETYTTVAKLRAATEGECTQMPRGMFRNVCYLTCVYIFLGHPIVWFRWGLLHENTKRRLSEELFAALKSEDHFFSEHYTLCFRLNNQLIFFPLFRFQVISWLVSQLISHIVDLLLVKPCHGHSLPLAKPSFTHFLLISYAILVLFCQDWLQKWLLKIGLSQHLLLENEKRWQKRRKKPPSLLTAECYALCLQHPAKRWI